MGGHDGYAVVIAYDPIPGMHGQSTALHRNVDFSGIFRATCVRDDRPCENGERVLANLGAIPNRPVNYHSGQPLEPSRSRDDAAPQGGVALPVAVDHENPIRRAIRKGLADHQDVRRVNPNCECRPGHRTVRRAALDAVIHGTGLAEGVR